VPEKCNRCGECDLSCPDYCFVWEKGTDPKTKKEGMMLLGIDYQFCKGCMRCVAVCKVEALVTAMEADHDIDKIAVKIRART
jgi:pyruvate ferredoxin oxidoreductase gamma subunit